MTMHARYDRSLLPTRALGRSSGSLRRRAALLATTALLAVPALASCGFDAATDRVNTISAGVNNRDGNIDVLGAVVVATGAGTGLFEATLSNNSTLAETTQADQLVSIAPEGGSTATVNTVASFKPITINPSASVSMFATAAGVPLTGSFSPGSFVSVTLTFQSGQQTTMTVPVVQPCYQYADVTATATDSATPLIGSTGKGGTGAKGGKGASASPTPSATPLIPTDAASDPALSCSPETGGVGSATP
jgi:hypothetical protein